jgi:hypothetical protein
MQFEKATRMKLRFDTSRGVLTVEDLWDLPLIGSDLCLDEIAKDLHRDLKDDSEQSFVVQTAKPDERLVLAFEIVKRVISVRLVEQEAAENAEALRQKKQKILAIIADKEDESLKETSVEDLRALLDSL